LIRPGKRVHNFEITPREYSSRGKNNLFPDFYKCSNPKCSYQDRLWRNGFYRRNVIWFDAIYTIFVQRYRCPVCGHTVSALPTFVLPYYQYALAVIFLCFQAISIMKMSYKQAAGHVHSRYLKEQHIHFYKDRFNSCAKLSVPVLLNLGCVSPIQNDNSSLLFTWVTYIKCHSTAESFTVRFLEMWSISFLSKALANSS
jgi:transposase-like protein